MSSSAVPVISILWAMPSVSFFSTANALILAMARCLGLYIFCSLLCVANLLSQEHMAEKLPELQCDILSFATPKLSPDSARTDIYIAVPFSWLNFLNAGEKYVADYSVKLTLSPKGIANEVHNREQSSSVVLATAEWEKLQELDLTRADASQYSFTLKQGAVYNVHITIRDLSSHKLISDDRDFTVSTFVSLAPSISDILLYKSRSGTRVTPHIGADISDLKLDEAGSFLDIYNAPQSLPFYLVQRISTVGEEHEEIARNTKVLIPTGLRRMPVFLQFPDQDLWSGKYILETFVLADAKDTLLVKSDALIRQALVYRTRELVINNAHGVPIAGIDPDEAIAQLDYITSGGAYDSLHHAETKLEKRKAIMEFWEKMNWYRGQRTTRPMEVFYRRVEYANEHFKSMGPGWRTDRGKVYIMLGAPTQTDRHPYDANSKPYEIWQYYDLSERYYFSDQFMIGDYRLVSISPIPGIFLWQRESY